MNINGNYLRYNNFLYESCPGGTIQKNATDCELIYSHK